MAEHFEGVAAKDMCQEKLALHKRRIRRIKAAVLVLILITAVAVTAFFTVYISSYTVTGNVYVEDKEIVDELFSSPMEQRFFFSYFRNLLGKNSKVRYLSEYKLSFSTDRSVTIEVTENAIVGSLMRDQNIYYFDRYGNILAVNIENPPDVPMIEGDGFENVSLYGQLKTSSSSLVSDMLSLTQLLSGYGITADSISYDEDEATIIMGDIKVCVGDSSAMAGKISELNDIINSGKLEGLKGTLHLESYSESSKSSSFIFDRE